jgi:eukaryotic-like serine/threonine-protein kinase
MALPERIGRFRVVARLGSGAFATVWLAHDEELDSPVAVKVLADIWSYDEDIQERFLAEARHLRHLDSDRIVRAYEVGRLEDGRPYIVLEYVDGGTLEHRMQQRFTAGASFSIEEVVRYGAELAECLDVAHALKIVHRDLKPSNVLFKRIPDHQQELMRHRGQAVVEERMLLGDFGIARSLAGTVRKTMVVGTPHYVAPEQADPDMATEADHRCDIYSASVVIYELLAGQVPWPYDSFTRVLEAQRRQDISPIGEYRADVPDALSRAVQKGLERDPERRYSSAWEWGLALEQSISLTAGRFSGVYAPGRTVPPVPSRRDLDRSYQSEQDPREAEERARTEGEERARRPEEQKEVSEQLERESSGRVTSRRTALLVASLISFVGIWVSLEQPGPLADGGRALFIGLGLVLLGLLCSFIPRMARRSKPLVEGAAEAIMASKGLLAASVVLSVAATVALYDAVARTPAEFISQFPVPSLIADRNLLTALAFGLSPIAWVAAPLFVGVGLRLGRVRVGFGAGLLIALGAGDFLLFLGYGISLPPLDEVLVWYMAGGLLMVVSGWLAYRAIGKVAQGVVPSADSADQPALLWRRAMPIGGAVLMVIAPFVPFIVFGATPLSIVDVFLLKGSIEYLAAPIAIIALTLVPLTPPWRRGLVSGTIAGLGGFNLSLHLFILGEPFHLADDGAGPGAFLGVAGAGLVLLSTWWSYRPLIGREPAPSSRPVDDPARAAAGG